MTDLHTHFLPPERADAVEIERLRSVFLDLPLLKTLLDGVPDGVMVVNPERQILFANAAVLEALGAGSER